MFAGLLTGLWGLVFNPAAWVAVAMSATVAFGGGFVKGHGFANARHWQERAAALEDAARKKDEILKRDAARLADEQRRSDDLEQELAKMVEAANHDKGACALSDADLSELRDLARRGS